MKIFHTGDWHIGKIVNQVHMTQDQAYALHHLVELMELEKPDVLIIAGDIYDRAVPPVEAVELLDDTLSKILLKLQIPVFIISGNHDSPDRLGFGSNILRAKGLHIAGRFQEDVEMITLRDQHGPVNFYLIPYASPAVVKDMLGGEEIHDHDTALKAIIERIKEKWSPQERNILVYHGFVSGINELEFSDSEKPLSLTSIGGADYINVAHFADFTYTALGHLHGPQRAGHERVRYSGSLLKYSFSESSQNKAITVVNIGEDGAVEYEYRSLKTLRDMRKIKGSLHDLLNPAFDQTNIAACADTHTYLQDYLHVTLTDRGELIEPMAKLRQVYPNILSLEFETQERQAGENKTSAGEGYKQKSKLELFRDFYRDITGKEFTAEKERIIADILEEIRTEERGA